MAAERKITVSMNIVFHFKLKGEPWTRAVKKPEAASFAILGIKMGSWKRKPNKFEN